MALVQRGPLQSAGAVVTVDDARFDLAEGEWLLKPGGTPHQLDSTVPGTSWLAVRGPGPAPPASAGRRPSGEASGSAAPPSAG